MRTKYLKKEKSEGRIAKKRNSPLCVQKGNKIDEKYE